MYFPTTEQDSEDRNDTFTDHKRYGNGEMVLVVEDEPSVRQLICTLLKELGYSTVQASHGGEAFEIVENIGEHEIDLLITDVVMPEMSGGDLAEKLAAKYPDLNILFMTGYTDEDIVRHGLITENSFLIQKPFSSDDLAKKVEQALNAQNVRSLRE